MWLNPPDLNIISQVNALHQWSTQIKPSSRILSFVDTLLLRFPDVSATGKNAIWTVTPLHDQIIGHFVDLPVDWAHYEDVQPFIVDTAIAHQPRCYDLDEGQMYPVRCH